MTPMSNIVLVLAPVTLDGAPGWVSAVSVILSGDGRATTGNMVEDCTHGYWGIRQN
jgi:hypothetical protein